MHDAVRVAIARRFQDLTHVVAAHTHTPRQNSSVWGQDGIAQFGDRAAQFGDRTAQFGDRTEQLSYGTEWLSWEGGIAERNRIA